MAFNFLQILSEYKPKVTDSPTDKLVLCVGIILGLTLIIALLIAVHDSGRER